MRYLSVCSGIEAATVAWDAMAWVPVAFAEVDKFPSAVLAHHYPSVPNWGDMTKFKEWPDADVDVLVGGTPCQSFSVAGLRKGLADPRGNLMLTYLAILDRYRPTWMVWENVPGVLSSNSGRDFGAFLGALGELGYGWSYRSLDAQYFHLAQRRERVFVVGCLGGWERAAQVLFEPESLSGYPAPSRETGKRVAPTLSARTKGGGGLGTDFDCDGGLVAGTYWDGGDLADTLDASNASKQQMMPEKRMFQAVVTGPVTRNPYGDHESRESLLVAHALRADGFDASEDGTGRGTPLVPVAFSCKDYGADASAVAPTMRAMGHDQSHANAGGQLAVAFRSAGDGAAYEMGSATAPLTTGTDPSANILVNRWAVRRLTPVECCRLQGFPDAYLDITYHGKPAADWPKYKALGNSMAVTVMSWIGRRIAMVDSQ
jgi:DNA (cytosine-5)-methyltransferase 1